MELAVTARYLLVPVRAGATKRTFRLSLGEDLLREFEVELATDGQPEWWAFYDLAPWLGEVLELASSAGVTDTELARLAVCLDQADQPRGQENLYRERLRPQYHFTSRRGWNNDPNGLVYHAGEWHLFYQHNPFGTGWGNMHWGHAVSSDLVHWEELPTALYPRSLGDQAFSGGAVVDSANTTGWGAAEPALIASYTSTGRGECLAYSTDRGRTFADYAGNPVLQHRGRDPKIIWYEPERKWVMVVYDESPGRRYAFYDSPDLCSWRYLSAVEGLYADPLDGFYECPELFCLPLDGRADQPRWVLHGAIRRTVDGQEQTTRSSYLVGRFDGQRFVAEGPVVEGHLGPHFYAAQAFSQAPNDRVILVGWLAGAVYPGMPFSQGMTVPLELALRSTPAGPRLSFLPVAELAALRRRSQQAEHLTASAANELLAAVEAELLDLTLELEVATPLVWDLHGTMLEVDAGRLRFGGLEVPLPVLDGRLTLRVLLDRAVVEIFAQDGLVAMARGGLAEQTRSLHLMLPQGGDIRGLTIHELSPAWA
ncbi:MAG: glycoside hydrolase family 32 protein [Armatimonadetes bacterium]|nr:glycoside hydrolase family 32 protein [Armatimonadota bacterium]